jgi:hypothetical protein
MGLYKNPGCDGNVKLASLCRSDCSNLQVTKVRFHNGVIVTDTWLLDQCTQTALQILWMADPGNVRQIHFRGPNAPGAGLHWTSMPEARVQIWIRGDADMYFSSKHSPTL